MKAAREFSADPKTQHDTHNIEHSVSGRLGLSRAIDNSVSEKGTKSVVDSIPYCKFVTPEDLLHVPDTIRDNTFTY